MFIALIGTRFSGKSTVEEYLIKQRGFTPVRLIAENVRYRRNLFVSDELLVAQNGENPRQPPVTSPKDDGAIISGRNRPKLEPLTSTQQDRPISFLMMNSPISPSFPQGVKESFPQQSQEVCFQTRGQLLEHVTRNWRSNFVTLDLNTQELIETFLTRPFFMVVCVDAPLLYRFRRSSM